MHRIRKHSNFVLTRMPSPTHEQLSPHFCERPHLDGGEAALNDRNGRGAHARAAKHLGQLSTLLRHPKPLRAMPDAPEPVVRTTGSLTAQSDPFLTFGPTQGRPERDWNRAATRAAAAGVRLPTMARRGRDRRAQMRGNSHPRPSSWRQRWKHLPRPLASRPRWPC